MQDRNNNSILPTGTVTFLFTDIVGSTPLWERQPDWMAEALEIHHTALREAIEIPIPPVERAEYDASLDTLRHKLGEARFEKLLAEGRAMSIDAAVELALDGTVETPEIVEK